MSSEADRRTSVESAIAEVLAAERDAVAEIAACESRADAILQDARQLMRALTRQAQGRISRLHGGCAERNRQLVEELERDAAAHRSASLPNDGIAERLTEAVTDVARELTERSVPDAE